MESGDGTAQQRHARHWQAAKQQGADADRHRERDDSAAREQDDAANMRREPLRVKSFELLRAQDPNNKAIDYGGGQDGRFPRDPLVF